MINLYLYDSMLVIKPWKTVFKKPLTGTRHVKEKQFFKTRKGGYYKVVDAYKKEPLFEVQQSQDNSYVGVAYPGCIGMFTKFLDQRQYQYKLQDLCSKVDPPDYSLLDLPTPRKGQLEALSVMATTSHAIIEAPPGWGKTYILTRYCQIYPNKKIVIITHKSSVRDSIGRRVQEAIPDKEVVVLANGKDSDTATVKVLCDKSLHKLMDGWADILIYDEAHNAGSLDVNKKLRRFIGCRTYGLSATPEGRSDGSDKQTQAVLGPILLRIPYSAAVKDKSVAPVEVEMFPIRLSNISEQKLERMPPHLKNATCIINNHDRSRIIGETVRRVVPAEEQVLIMTDRTRHVYNLKKFLPGAVCVHRPVDPINWDTFLRENVVGPEDTMNPDVDAILKQFEDKEIRVVIATRIWDEGIDLPDLRWAVRADGTAGKIYSIQFGGRAGRYKEGKIAKLVSFIDYHNTLETRSTQQIKAYRKNGWKVTKHRSLPNTPFLW